ncbi:MAG: ATP-dependent DNA helicase UvrD2 [Acidimicrobiales bacterium]|nr:ATP-dependent DNA helicase UvrD2 [Acidimicrobiales bacterium]
MISCGHCGDRHPTVAEVRSCSGAPAGAATAEEPTMFDEPRAARRAPDAVAPVELTAAWDHLAGPAALGRNVVVLPGQTAPAPWADAPRITVDDGPDAIAKLRAARADRERVVIELATDLPEPDPVLAVDYWHLSPETDLEGDILRLLVLDHSVDARRPDAPTIAAVSAAVAAGATPRTAGPGDVDTPDGPAWVDGGPLDWFDDIDLGAPVVPAAHLGIGSLAPLRHTPPDADLAPDQLAAVAHGGGGARIIAPAGSGKTRVLTERARHLVRDRGIDPSTICLVAFNVRAREEMQERTTDLAGLEIRTLNSLALAILSGRGPFASPADRSAPRVIDEREVRRVLDDLVGGRRQAMADPMAVWIEALTASRLGLRSPAAVEKEFGGDVKEFASVLPEFRRRLRGAGVVDFDEQILGAIEVLCTDPAARRAARQACGVLLVDEFQDLTPAHVLLLRLLAGPRADVFGVGDDDQTIYGYAGASPSWLIDFADLFPGSGAHDLTINYRCPPAVVSGAATLLTHNRRRVDKTITAAKGREDGGDALEIASSPDPLGATVAEVTRLVEHGVAPADIAVLTRVNATLLGPMLLLGEAGIATSAPVDANFLERTGVAGALAWLRVAVAPEQALPATALETAVRRPPRGISRRLAEWVGEQRSPRQLDQLAGRLNNARDQDKILAFAEDVRMIRGLADDGADTATLLAAIRDRVGLGQALDNRLDASRRSVDRSAHGDDLAALLAVAGAQPDPNRFGPWLAERLTDREPDWAGVRLSTIHRVKGREWPHVIVHDATAGLMPHRLAADREEERRVFHVAVTRASRRALVTTGEPPSPFVAQLTTPRDPDAEPEPELRPARARPTERKSRDVPEVGSLAEASLRESLKAWRSETAKATGMPAYVVFNDATLYDLARLRPIDDDELLAVPGIGPVKIEKYGEEILAIIEDALAPEDDESV